MKKLLALLLFLSFSMSAFAAPTILPKEEIPLLESDSIEAFGLNKLDILRGRGNGFNLEGTLTRAEAVVLALRLSPSVIGAMGLPSPEFSDMDGHWAYKEVTSAKKMGLIAGTSDTTFNPDRQVSGKEFAKILLSVLGYNNVSIENAYDMGEDCGLINNNFTRSVVFDNRPLLRGDAMRLCWSALVSKTADEKLLYNKLIESGKYKKDDFDGILFVSDSDFTDKLNAMMPGDKNYMFSPLSIKMAFAMAANGASGETKSQILNALRISDLEKYNSDSMELIEKYNSAEILKLNVANSIWLNKSATSQNYSEAFSDILTRFYKAEAFSANKETIVGDINSWVKDKTNGKISEIIKDDDFSSVLINAVYFKGNWRNEFSKDATKPDIFTNGDGSEKTVDFMNKTAYYEYYKDGETEIINLPYLNFEYDEKTGQAVGHDLDISMYLINGKFSTSRLNSIIDSRLLNSKYISLSMPKFEFEYEAPLKKMMIELGVTDAFTENAANFMPMFDTGNMFLTDALHKTYISVDEKGTEAAAVTALTGNTTSLPPTPIEVKFNKPFTFVIRDNNSGEILFLGEYSFAGK